MQQKLLNTLLLPLLATFALLSLPRAKSEAIRTSVCEKVAIIWSIFNPSRDLKDPILAATSEADAQEAESELAMENTFLQEEIRRLKALVDLYRLKQPFDQEPNRSSSEGILAKVIFRSAGSWNSSLWINVGKKHNEGYSTPVIAKNSPVLSKDAVVGVIDYVGETHSRVRLISDSRLVPAVRAARGAIQSRAIVSSINEIISFFQEKEQILPDKDNLNACIHYLSQIKGILNNDDATHYLAKGELYGSSEPLWRKTGQYLKGCGFNYDFKDSKGPARDLRTGEVIDPPENFSGTTIMPILQTGDLLVTSGLDGVFPEGLKIAKVHSISPLKEGAYSYDILATPVASDLYDLKYLFVIPPAGPHPEDLIESGN